MNQLNFITRLAKSDEGFVIQELMIISGMPNLKGVDWSRNIHPYWLICSDDSKHEYYGCLSLLYSKPIGGLEFLFLHPSLSKTQKLKVMYSICTNGVDELKKHGCQLVAMCITTEKFPYFGKFLKKYLNAVKSNQSLDVYLRRV